MTKQDSSPSAEVTTSVTETPTLLTGTPTKSEAVSVPQGARLASLSDVLTRYVTVDALEREHLRRMQTLVKSGEQSLLRDNYVPGHFTASAFVLNPERTHLLLIFHSKLQLWLQPGGHVDDTDASLEHAARREVAEETGKHELESILPAPLDLDVHRIPARLDMPAHEHFDVRFLFVAPDMAHAAGSDALAAQWVPLTELSSVATDESIRRSARKIVRLLSNPETRA